MFGISCAFLLPFSSFYFAFGLFIVIFEARTWTHTIPKRIKVQSLSKQNAFAPALLMPTSVWSEYNISTINNSFASI